MIQDIRVAQVALGIGITIAVALIACWIWLSIWNSRQPLKTISVKVVAKRTEVGGGMGNMPSSTNYFVTFEHENGKREEFPVSGTEYGMIAEGDWGTIGRQGSWFKGFKLSKAAAR